MAAAEAGSPAMFCYQCEQTAQGSGCTAFGVCGKDPETAALQDLLVHATKGLGQYGHRLRDVGERDRQADHFAAKALFVTLTNVNFDSEAIAQWIRRAVEVRERVRNAYVEACGNAGCEPDAPGGPATLEPADDLDELIRQGEQVSIQQRIEDLGETTAGLEELAIYGLKGAAAYLDHAAILGQDDPEAFAELHAILDALSRHDHSADDLLGLALRVGELNLKAMELLDAANTGAYGHPEPTSMRVTPVAGKCIAVSGHDLKDLGDLLEQTAGKGINVYTHGEMLMCNSYPELKKYDHFVGHFGGAWQDQRKDFDEFPGAVLMTTNCLQKPKSSYEGRLFTTGTVGWSGVQHIEEGPDGKKDFTPVIDAALAAPGFEEDAEEKRIMTGFAHNAVMSVADKVVEAVKAGKIRHFFLIGGCDGAKPGRNYYTELAQAVPDDCVILTLACGKFRFNRLEFGDIGGIPRLLDVGQCNDAYSAIQIALALAEAFDCEINDLPLSMVLSWFEQKAVAILLTLLALGVRDIRLGPSLPAFVTPPVLGILAEKFNIAPISEPEMDLAACLEA